jgi:ubiquitin
LFVAFFAPYDFTGKAITVKAELTDTIGVIKRKMAEKEHIPPDQHNLMFAGEQLQVGAFTHSYNAHMPLLRPSHMMRITAGSRYMWSHLSARSPIQNPSA